MPFTFKLCFEKILARGMSFDAVTLGRRLYSLNE